MLVSALFSIEDINYNDLEEFSDTIQDSELKENTIVFFKVLSECLHLPKSQTKDFCSDDSPQNQRARRLFGDANSDDLTQTASYNSSNFAKVNISVPLPNYDGAKGKAARFVHEFTELMEAQNYDQFQWGTLLRTCLKKDALDYFTTQRPKFSDWDSFFGAFRMFFDNRSADNEYHYFASYLKQQDHKDYDKWFLRFERKVQELQITKQIPQRNESTFHLFYMRTLYSKLNRFCFAVVDKKLKDLSKSVGNCSTDDFKRWIDDAKQTEKIFLAFSRNNQPPRHGKKKNNFSHKHSVNSQKDNQQRTDVESQQKKVLHCYYCDQDGHIHRNKTTKVWLCPKKLAGEPPCEKWNKHQESFNKPKANANVVMADTETEEK